MANDPKNISGAQFPQPAEAFSVRSATSRLKFLTENIPPPGNCYVGVDDRLMVWGLAVFNVNTVAVNVRILRDDGEIIAIAFRVVITPTQTIASQTFQLVEGFILSASIVSESASAGVNQAFAGIAIIRPPNTALAQYELLTSGYVNSQWPISYPSYPPQRPTDGPGIPQSVVIGSPAAGTDWALTISTSRRQRVIAASGLLTSAVAVANRIPSLFIDDGANVYCVSPSGNTQVASTAVQYTWADSTPLVAVTDAKVIAPMPSNLILPVAHRIRVVTTGLQAADQWSNVTLLTNTWADFG